MTAEREAMKLVRPMAEGQAPGARDGWSDRRASPGGACEPGYERLRPR